MQDFGAMMRALMQGGQGLVQQAGGPRGPQGTVGAVPILQITPEISKRLERRVQNAGDDEELSRVVRDAAKYGVDWSYLLGK
jgi:hypothetical protein